MSEDQIWLHSFLVVFQSIMWFVNKEIWKRTYKTLGLDDRTIPLLFNILIGLWCFGWATYSFSLIISFLVG